MLAILIKHLLKKNRRNKVTSKNKYDHNKSTRYLRKLHITKEEFEETEKNGENTAENTVEENAEPDENSGNEDEVTSENNPDGDDGNQN